MIDDTLTPVAIAAIAVEIALLLAGLWLLWRQALSPAARGSRPPLRLGTWAASPTEFFAISCLVILGAVVATSLAGLAVRRWHLDADTALIYGSAAMHVGILASLAGVRLLTGLMPARGPALDREEPSGEPAPRPSALRSGAATFLIALPIVIAVSNLWESLLSHCGLPAEKQDLVDILETTNSNSLRATLVVVATILVPITEELVFRAGLFRYLRTRIPRWVALVGAALLFGAGHVDWSTLSGLASLAPLTVLAIVFSLAYERTGSIWTTVVAHALFNLNTFVLIAAGAGS